MGAVGDVGPATGRPVADGRIPGLVGSFGAGLRLLVGWCSVTTAILNLISELDRLPEPAYLLFHGVLLVGGLLLVSFGPGTIGPAGYAGFGAVLTGGTLISALPASDAVCCMSAYAVRHGYPFTFLARDGDGRPHVDGPHLLADLLFWGYAGLIVLVLVAGARRAAKHHRGKGKVARP